MTWRVILLWLFVTSATGHLFEPPFASVLTFQTFDRRRSDFGCLCGHSLRSLRLCANLVSSPKRACKCHSLNYGPRRWRFGRCPLTSDSWLRALLWQNFPFSAVESAFYRLSDCPKATCEEIKKLFDFRPRTANVLVQCRKKDLS